MEQNIQTQHHKDHSMSTYKLQVTTIPSETIPCDHHTRWPLCQV